MENNLKNIYLNQFAVHLKLTQYCKSTILQLKKPKKTPPLEEHLGGTESGIGSRLGAHISELPHRLGKKKGIQAPCLTYLCFWNHWILLS